MVRILKILSAILLGIMFVAAIGYAISRYFDIFVGPYYKMKASFDKTQDSGVEPVPAEACGDEYF